MCGILGIACYNESPIDFRLAGDIRTLTRRLLVTSQHRGSDASGLCVLSGDKATMFKTDLPSKDMVKEHEYGKVINDISHNRRFRSMIGHTRMRTKGDPIYNVNNHPIRANRVIGVHNGIISNDDVLFGTYSDVIHRAGRVDSEIIFRLIDYHISKGESIVNAVKDADRELIGGYACAFIHRDHPNYLIIFSSGQPVPIFIFDKSKTVVFASTASIITESMQKGSVIGDPSRPDEVVTVKSSGARLNLDTGKIYEFELSSPYGYGENADAYKQVGFTM